MRNIVLLLFLGCGLVRGLDLFSEDFETGGPGRFSVVETGVSFSYPNGAEGGAVPSKAVFFKGATGEELKLENDGGFSSLPANTVFEVAFDYFEPDGVAEAVAERRSAGAGGRCDWKRGDFDRSRFFERDRSCRAMGVIWCPGLTRRTSW